MSLNQSRFLTIYITVYSQDLTERIPYEEALENKCKLQEYIMINNALQEELQKLEDTVTSLEQEKIRLQNECQIMEKKNSNPVRTIKIILLYSLVVIIFEFSILMLADKLFIAS